MRRMGKGVHSSIKTYYFGGLCTFFTMIYIAYDGIEMYHFHKIGTDAYPINRDQLLSCFAIGFFSWANQESLSLCLTVVKQGVATTFNNIALIVSFFVDTFYFGRMVLPQDILGTSLIVLFSIAQCLLSDKATKKEIKEKQSSMKDLVKSLEKSDEKQGTAADLTSEEDPDSDPDFKL